MNKRVLLVNCAISMEGRKKINEAVSSPSIGLLSIASVLKMHGYEVRILDFFVERITGKQFVSFLEEYNPGVIGFSVYTRTVPFLDKMTQILKKIHYKGIIVAGGPHASFCQEEMLQKYHVDYVISGEGEFSFLKLMEHINYGYPIAKVKGVSYMEGSEICINPASGQIEILDALPLQPIGLVDADKYSSPFSIITSRGCPGNCIYCASRALQGRKYRMRSAENIICELIYMSKALNKVTFLILDDTFTADVVRFKKFANLIKKSNIPFQFRIESRGDVLNYEILKMLKEINCKIIHVGIESGSQEVISQIGKKIDLESTIEKLYQGSQLGIHIVASFIIGHYCDTEQTVEESLTLMKKLTESGIEVSVASLTPFPGTPLYNNRDKLQLHIHANSWQEYDFGNVIVSTKYLSREKLQEYLYRAAEIWMQQ